MSENVFEEGKVHLINLLSGFKIINEEVKNNSYGIWKGDENLLNNFKQLKEQSERLSNTCTKVGMVNNSFFFFFSFLFFIIIYYCMVRLM